MLRDYFPKGTDLRVHSAERLVAVAAQLNGRPRKILGWATPATVYDEHLRQAYLDADGTAYEWASDSGQVLSGPGLLLRR